MFSERRAIVFFSHNGEMEERLDKSLELQEETIKFTKKLLRELTGKSAEKQVRLSTTAVESELVEKQKVIYSGKDLTNMSGDTPTCLPKT